MRHSLKTGFSFGLTSGVITTLGLMVGLHSSTHLKSVVIAGILTIAIADALSDAMGIHVSEESEGKHTAKEIWESTASTFITKFVFALMFIIPVLLLQLTTAVVVSVIWGLSIITVFSWYMAKKQGTRPYKVVLEHLFIAVLVIALTHYIGEWVATFGQNTPV